MDKVLLRACVRVLCHLLSSQAWFRPNLENFRHLLVVLDRAKEAFYTTMMAGGAFFLF